MAVPLFVWRSGCLIFVWLVGWLDGWLFHQLFGEVVCFFDCLVVFFGWLFHWLFEGVVCLIVCLAVCLVGWFVFFVRA